MATIILKYSISKVSSEDEEYSASELLSPGTGCKGWVTDQYCVYPQVNIIPKNNSIITSHVEIMTIGF